MLLIGVNRSPYTRRVAIVLEQYGMAYEKRDLTGFANWEEVKVSNPLGRIPALILDNGEALVDSAAIIDHLDEVYGRERALMPPSGADRRAVLHHVSLMIGACDKGLHAAYERNHHPPEKVHLPWIEDCTKRMRSALKAIDEMAAPGEYLLLGRLTHADITAFVAERLARVGLGVDTEKEMPRLRALTKRLIEQPAFAKTEPS
jgi:glutathione S-transferase